MRATSKLLALALTAAFQPAFAGLVSLNFEDITVNSDPLGVGMVQLNDRYKSEGVLFSGSAWGVVAWDAGAANATCNGYVQFLPFGGGCGGLLLSTDPTDPNAPTGNTKFTMNFADGFITGSSFIYSALTGSDVIITLYDGVDGKGNATRVTGLKPGDCGLTDGTRFCTWTPLQLDFAGTARSIVISGNSETLMLDNLRLVTADPGTPVPEPASLALALGALGALGWARKRAAR